LAIPNALIIMHGGPATGKTTVGVPLAERFGIPYISKDGVKEPMFDSIGIPTGWPYEETLSGRKMDDASIQILLYLIEAQMKAGCGCVIDSTFQAPTAPAIRDLAEQYGFTPIQIVCTADVEVVAARYRSRFENNERHPGHQDKRLSDDFDAEAVAKLFKPLDIGGHMLNVDSTEFTDQDFESLVKSVENILN